MYEAIPLGTGILLGVLVGSLRPRPLWTALVAIIAVAVGFLAASMSGEMEISWGFVLFDVGQVLVMYALAAWLARTVTARRGFGAHEGGAPG